MNEDNKILNSFWRKLIYAPWVLGSLLIFIWGIPRFMLVLMANESGSYQWVPLIFITMWISPWIFLSKYGRKKIGLKKPASFKWLIFAFIFGMICCTLMFVIASFLYEETISNWFVYISNSYSNVPENISSSDKLIYFTIYAIISMTFSPIGEELFYRGIVHECFATKYNVRTASYIDSLAFSFTHLAHFGIVYTVGEWQFLPFPALLWMLLLFFTCLVFSYMKMKSDSIMGAIFAHAGFNLTMMYFIFFFVI